MMFGQLHPDKKSLAVNPLVGPIPVANIESFKGALTKSNPGYTATSTASQYNIRGSAYKFPTHRRRSENKILQDQFEQWLENKLKIISKTIHF